MLESLRATIPASLPYEIILIDDCSTDGTQAWLKTLDDPRIKTLFNPRNLGYAKTNNAAIAIATGQILALLNNDLLFDTGWLEPMLTLLEDPVLNAGVVGNLQRRVRDGGLDHAGICVTPQGKIEHIQVLPDAQLAYAKVFAVTGACCLIRKADFDRAGGFDEAFVNGGEDVDLCLKVRQSGKGVYLATGSSVRHHVSLSRNRADPQNERNSRRLYSGWRKEIKAELARVWLPLLQQGEFTPAALATPHTLARVVAESVLRREEAYWARTLDGADVNANLAGRCSVQILAEAGFELSVQGLSSARNFYVCGYKTGQPPTEAIAITITVNGIQQQTFTLGAEPNFNVGIINPVVLPGLANCFKVTFQGDASKAVVITQLVLDDQILKGDGTLFPLRTST